ncbi:MAG: ubiquinol-cytochrome c reductase iron-sulfur subunit [Chloroflexota bacterium]|nr:ubiquinol-cytochrome c reductase iron-sulfur subunit [Chloroflexota bacterium]
MDRRSFLSRMIVGLSGAIAAILGLPIIGYLLGPLIEPTPAKYVDVGAVSDFAVGQTKLVKFRDPSPLPWAGQLADTALWVRHREQGGPDEFRVFSIHCTHLGCPVNWRPGAGLFECPCHGGVFYADGQVAGGPPQRPLYQLKWRVVNGRLQIESAPLPTVQTKA